MKFSYATVLVVLVATVGCVKTQSDAERQARFRQQLAETGVVRAWKTQVRDVRFSADSKRVLVLFDLPAGSIAKPEVVLSDDGFQRYRGDWDLGLGASTTITVDLASK